MTEFNLIAKVGGVAQLQCPTCFAKFIKASYMLKYESIDGKIIVSIECPVCKYQNWSYMED